MATESPDRMRYPVSSRESPRTNWPTDAPMDEAEYYDLLTNGRRRACIAHLLSTDGAVSVSDLVDSVAAAEADGDVGQQHRKSIYVSLRQTHLPRLAEHDVVDFDTDRNVVEAAAALDLFDDPGPDVAKPSQHLPWAFIVIGILGLAWMTGGVLGVFDLLDNGILLVATGYVFLFFVLGLWEVHRLRSELDYPPSSGR